MASPDLPSLIRAELSGHAWGAIYLRYIAAAAVFFCTIVLTQNMGAQLDPTALWAIAGTLIVTNILYSVHLSRAAQESGRASPQAAAGSVALQTATDLFLLTMLLHFSGGVSNPLMALYAGPIVLSGFLLSRRATYALAFLALLLYGGMAVLEYRQVIPHIPVPGLFPPALYRSESYLAVVLVSLGIVVGMAAVVSLMVSGRLGLGSVPTQVGEDRPA